MIAGTLTPLTPPSDEVLKSVHGFVESARCTAGICTGTFVLAQAGVLDNRRATTHWAYAKALQGMHPSIEVEQDRIFIVDGPVWTSAGMTAGLDMALGMIEKDLGAEIARSVAHKLVMHQRRSGGQSQRSKLLSMPPKSDSIQNALDYARRHLNHPLSVEELAEVVHLSPRHSPESSGPTSCQGSGKLAPGGCPPDDRADSPRPGYGGPGNRIQRSPPYVGNVRPGFWCASASGSPGREAK